MKILVNIYNYVTYLLTYAFSRYNVNLSKYLTTYMRN